MWDLQRYIYPWPTKDQEVLFRNFSIQDHAQSRQGTGVEYGVFVQVLNNTPAEAGIVTVYYMSYYHIYFSSNIMNSSCYCRLQDFRGPLLEYWRGAWKFVEINIFVGEMNNGHKA